MKLKREPVLRAEYRAQLRQADGSQIEALFYCFDDSMANLDEPCRLVVKFNGEELKGTDRDFFAALDKVRLQLEARGILPLVNGANKTSYPSSMARDMGSGLSVYRLQLGKPMGDLEDLVQTFEANIIDQVSSVVDQRSFVEQWHKSFAK